MRRTINIEEEAITKQAKICRESNNTGLRALFSKIVVCWGAHILKSITNLENRSIIIKQA